MLKAARKAATVGIWVDAGSLSNNNATASAVHLASNLRQLGAAFGQLSSATYYEDCIAFSSPSERLFRGELGNSGVDVLHRRPPVGAQKAGPNETLQEDLARFVEENASGPTALIIATKSRHLAPFLATLPAFSSDRQTIVLAPESLRSNYPPPIKFAPLQNLILASTPPKQKGPPTRPVLDIDALFGDARHEVARPQAPKFDLSEFFSPKPTR